MSSNRSVELVFRLRTEGREQAEAALRSIRGLNSEVAKGSAELRAFDGANRPVVERFRQLDGAAKQLLSTLGASPGVLGNYTSGLSAASEATGAITGASGLAVTAIGAVVAAAAAGAKTMFDLAKASGSLAEQQINVAARTGLTVKEVGLFTAAAEDAGLNANAYTTAMRTFSDALSDNSEDGKAAKRALAELGVEVRNQYGAVKPTAEIWLQLADKLGAVPDQARRTRLAIDILGRGGLELLPQMNRELRRAIDDLRDMGAGFDEVGAKSALAFDTALDRMNRWIEIQKQNGGVAVANVFGFGDKAPPVDPRASKAAALPFLAVKSLFSAPSAPAGPIATVNDGLTAADREAVRSAPIRAQIDDLLKREVDLTEKLAQAKKDLAAANRSNDLEGVKSSLAEIKRLEAQKKATDEAAQRAKATKDAELAASLELAKIEANRAGDFDKIIALHDIELRQLKEKGLLSEKLRGTLDSQTQARIANLGQDLTAKVPLKPARAPFSLLSAGSPLDQLFSPEVTAAAERGILLDPFQREVLDKDPNDALERTKRQLLEAKQSALDFQISLARALALPGQEVQAVKQITDLRISAAKQEFEIKKDSALLSQKINDAERQQVLELAQLRQRNAEQYRESAGRVWDAITSSGQGGIGAFIRGQGNLQGRALFQNLSGKLLESAGGFLGGLGAKSGLPAWVLRGTLADPQNAQLANITALDKNTISTDRLTQAIQQTIAGTASLGGSTIPGLPAGGVVPGFGSLPAGVSVQSLFPGSGSSSKLGEFGFGASTAYGGLFAGLGSGQIKRGENGYVLTGSEKFGNVVGSAAIVAGAGLGIYGGIKAGGARGISAAVASGLGAASAIPGPQQPFLAAAALAAGVIGSLLPDPKKQREEEINRSVANARYEDPRGTNRNVDLAGNEVDYDSRGRVRVINVYVNAMDSQSFMDRKQDLANAVGSALREGGTDLGDAVREQTNRY